MFSLELVDLPSLDRLEEILLGLTTEQIDRLNDFYGTSVGDIWHTGGPEIDLRLKYEKALGRQDDDRNLLVAKIFGSKRLSSEQKQSMKKIQELAAYVARVQHVAAGAGGALEHVVSSMVIAILARDAGLAVDKTDLAILLNAWRSCNFPLA